jgi:predicted NBD/HSP70 family sugar kinase
VERLEPKHVAGVLGKRGAGASCDNRPMPANPKVKSKPPKRILVLDVGGSHVKYRMGPRGKPGSFVSGPDMTAAQMVKQISQLIPRSAYEAVTIGYPGLVFHGRITAEPHNLGHGWVRFDFHKALGAPVRLINDAAMQAVGSYEGGRMLFLGLGTGLGATLILSGVVEPMEIGHMPYKRGRTYEDYVGERGRARAGTKKWRKAVHEVVDQLRNVLEVDYVVLGGGNAKRLKTLPKLSRLGDNRNAFTGGERLWRYATDPLVMAP